MTSVARAARARLVVAGTALACLTLLAGACGSASGSSVSSVSSTPVVSPSAGGSAPAGSSSSPAGTLTPAPARTLTAPPAYGVTGGGFTCPTASVKVTLGSSQDAGGTTLQVIDFTNTGSQLCSLGGYPGVSLAGGTPLAQIGLAAMVPAGGPVQAVSLNPGRVANSLLEIGHASNYPKATCDPVRAPYLVIAVPNAIGFVKLAYAATACAKPIEILSVSPITLGTGS
jgi:Protein of unknown function (DUF4232)